MNDRQVLYINFIDPNEQKEEILNKLYSKGIILSRREFKLFFYLYTNRNMILTQNHILDFVWGVDWAGIDVVRQYCYYLQDKIRKTDLKIVNHRSKGYQLQGEL